MWSVCIVLGFFFFFKQKTAYEMRISDWSSDVCSSDLVYGQSSMYFSNSAKSITPDTQIPGYGLVNLRYEWLEIYGSKYSVSAFIRNLADKESGRESCRGRVCQYV